MKSTKKSNPFAKFAAVKTDIIEATNCLRFRARDGAFISGTLVSLHFYPSNHPKATPLALLRIGAFLNPQGNFTRQSSSDPAASPGGVVCRAEPHATARNADPFATARIRRALAEVLKGNTAPPHEAGHAEVLLKKLSCPCVLGRDLANLRLILSWQDAGMCKRSQAVFNAAGIAFFDDIPLDAVCSVSVETIDHPNKRRTKSKVALASGRRDHGRPQVFPSKYASAEKIRSIQFDHKIAVSEELGLSAAPAKDDDNPGGQNSILMIEDTTMDLPLKHSVCGKLERTPVDNRIIYTIAVSPALSKPTDAKLRVHSLDDGRLVFEGVVSLAIDEFNRSTGKFDLTKKCLSGLNYRYECQLNQDKNYFEG